MSSTSKPYTPNCEIKEGMVVPADVQRWALVIEYHGAAFQGFQRQASAKHTVQGELEKALSKIANQPIAIVCAGRTDAGVHATQQVVHFDCPVKRPLKAWVEGVNTHLPPVIRVVSAQAVSLQFHARFSARARTYRYLTYISRVRPAICADSVTWSQHDLDVEKMEAAAHFMLGEHDFSAFRASQCQAHSPVRTLHSLRLLRRGNLVVMEVKANAFLHHMVRNIMGSMYLVGRGVRPVEWIEQLLQSKDRCLAAPTAPACGLYFVGVDYQDELNFKIEPKGPLFVEGIL